MDETTTCFMNGLIETLIEEENERLEKLKEQYKDLPDGSWSPSSYGLGMVHGIDVAVQKIYTMIAEYDN